MHITIHDFRGHNYAVRSFNHLRTITSDQTRIQIIRRFLFELVGDDITVYCYLFYLAELYLNILEKLKRYYNFGKQKILDVRRFQSKRLRALETGRFCPARSAKSLLNACWQTFRKTIPMKFNYFANFD